MPELLSVCRCLEGASDSILYLNISLISVLSSSPLKLFVPLTQLMAAKRSLCRCMIFKGELQQQRKILPLDPPTRLCKTRCLIN